MLEMDVRSNIKEVQGFTDRLMKKQIPFATSQALNDVAFGIRTHVVTRLYPVSFDLRNRGFARYLTRVDKSSKRNLEASVGAVDPERQSRADIIDQHEDGGTKRARDGGHMAIPNYDVLKRGVRGVRNSQRPRQVLEQKRVFKLDFKSRPGFGGIFKRVAKGKDGIVLLYNLVPVVHIDKTFPFNKTAHQIAVREIGPAYKKRMEKAIQTAKPPQGRRV